MVSTHHPLPPAPHLILPRGAVWSHIGEQEVAAGGAEVGAGPDEAEPRTQP